MVTDPPGVEWLDVGGFVPSDVVVVVLGGALVAVWVGVVVVVWGTAVDVVARLSDGARVELVLDSPELESCASVVDVERSSRDRSSTDGSTTTIVGSGSSEPTATIVVGITVTGWITRSRTCETATHESVRAAMAARLHRPANFNQLGTHSLSRRTHLVPLRRWLAKPQVTV